MYTRFQLARKYLNYCITASNGKGHGIHSPFVFEFIKNVLNDKKEYPCYAIIEDLRKKLLNDDTIIEVEDFGAGSAVIKSNQRMVKGIAASSLKAKKYAQLLFRMVKYYQPKTILELGTSFGMTTAYLGSAKDDADIHTCEGSLPIAEIARRNFEELKLKNIRLTKGDFAQTLTPLLARLNTIDFVFIDGNHQKEPTLEYFSKLLNFSTSSTILVFDDIHWSSEMESAWTAIQQHPSVTLTIDLFFIGLVFLNPDFKIPQHFIVRF